ncbi:uncharacterized protein BDW43DRAFT_282635 [Aspergillus alliaceus]|uniref:uncharacterized protein n=1 Tax=Petromyces alliaceus TaxID=209559 RepID=UPI0012A427AF|nr:uncharacterized protein BDW43DRAFT_282635 [Aspergillus alliaceus]KAB8231554.1 hypothetical protein BDW43DRAFT_282635 [Aspergillus alliaceus]
MRSGFHKPGAFPFLALLLISLLSLVASLAKEWDFYNLRFGYIGYQRNDVRQPSRVRDGSVDVRSRIRATGSQCKSWTINGYCLSDIDRVSRLKRAVPETPPRSSFEAATVLDTDSVVYLTEEPSTLTRGVRAFKSLFLKQLGDNQMLNPLPTGSASSVIPAPSSLTSNLSNLSVISAPPSSEAIFPKAHGGNFMLSAVGNSSQGNQYFLSHLRELWQQACCAVNVHLESRTTPGREQQPPSGSGTPNKEMSQVSDQSDRRTEEWAASKVLPSNGTNAALSTLPPTSPKSRVKPTFSPNATVAAEEWSKGVGLGPNSRPARGSCMAIVIGLVVGVMWF